MKKWFIACLLCFMSFFAMAEMVSDEDCTVHSEKIVKENVNNATIGFNVRYFFYSKSDYKFIVQVDIYYDKEFYETRLLGFQNGISASETFRQIVGRKPLIVWCIFRSMSEWEHGEYEDGKFYYCMNFDGIATLIEKEVWWDVMITNIRYEIEYQYSEVGK